MTEFNRKTNTIWIDCDQVLANFEYAAIKILGMPSREYEDLWGSDKSWAKLGEVPDFYLNLPLMPQAVALYYNIKHMHPVILTGSPSQMGEIARVHKFKWAEKHFGVNQRIVICQSKLKSMYCVPGDILIDDTVKYRSKWEGAGGIWITYESCDDTLEQLKKLNAI